MEDVVSVFADAPAELDAVVLMHDAALAGLLLPAQVDIPLADIRESIGVVVLLVQDLEVEHFDVAEVLAGKVPLRDALAGVEVPDLVDAGDAVGIERDRDVQVVDLLLIGKSGKGRNQCRQ